MKYGAILCDPPWAFEAYSHKGITQRSAESKYRTAHVNALAEIPVADFAAKDCALFMWAVDSHLDQAIELMKAWGFAYKTIGFVWVKVAKNGQPRMSMGLWTRKMSEVCLLGTRGKPVRQNKGIRQVIMAPRREHSRKPDEIYGRVEQLVNGPYLEMFARQRWPNWDAWGNETDKFETAA
jgi:N6-adenosine-specific RNA methylase IME4